MNLSFGRIITVGPEGMLGSQNMHVFRLVYINVKDNNTFIQDLFLLCSLVSVQLQTVTFSVFHRVYF